MGKIKKIINFDLSFIIMLIISIFTSSLSTFIISIVIILIHECFHLFASILFKVKPKAILITALGGIIDIPLYKLSPLKKTIVSLSGVVSNIIIIALVKIRIVDLKIYNEFLINYNLSLIFFSLLPIYPLDGYNIFQGLFEVIYKDRLSKGLNISQIISLICLFFFTIYACYSRNFGLLIIIVYLTCKNIIMLKQKDFLYLQTYQYYLINT